MRPGLRRLLALGASAALVAGSLSLSTPTAHAAEPDFNTFPRAQRTTITPEQVVFAPGQTGNARVTIDTRFAESSDWIYKGLRVTSSSGSFYVDRNTSVGELREVAISGDVSINHPRGYGYAYIIPQYAWKDAPTGPVYESWGYSSFRVLGQSRVTLQGSDSVKSGTSLTLTGKLDCFLRTGYAVPTSDYSSIEIQFREDGTDDWNSMGYATHNRDTGAFRYFQSAVGSEGDWRALSSSNTCTDGSSALKHVAIEGTPTDPPPPPPVSNAPAVRVSGKTHNTVSLTWTKPTQPGGTITGYRWGWTSANGLPQKTWDWVFPNPPNPFVMTNLAPENEYTMWVEAITAAGTGDRTTLSVTTNAAPKPPVVKPPVKPPVKPKPPVVKPPSVPKSVSYSRTKTTLTLRWAAPAANGKAIDRYQVKRSGKSAKTLKASARSYKFTKLKSGKYYTLSVRAHNSKGYSAWKSIRAVTTAKPPKAKEYKNCTELTRVYPHGVGRVGAVDNGGVTNFYRSNAVYEKNKKSDADRDGVACER